MIIEPMFVPGIVASVAIALMCGVLSPLVVLKRLAFVGQGVSHAAFGGVGVVLALGLGTPSTGLPLLIVVVFCALAALAMGWLGKRGTGGTDTAIGVVLVASMALGFVLHRYAAESAQARGLPAPPGLESVLFGSITLVNGAEALTAWIAGGAVVAVLAWFRRDAAFWAFDEPAAEAFGVPTGRVRALTMILLAVAVVITMRLAGVILATALLVLPGATALALSERLRTVMVCSVVCSLAGVAGGLALSFGAASLPVGPAVVLVLCLLYAAGRIVRSVR